MAINFRPNPGPTSPVSGFRMPTHEEMRAAYRSIAEAAMEQGTTIKLPGPPVPANQLAGWPRFDITPEGMMDLTRAVWEIQGTLYLQSSSIFGPQGRPFSTWEKIGPAPLF